MREFILLFALCNAIFESERFLIIDFNLYIDAL